MGELCGYIGLAVPRGTPGGTVHPRVLGHARVLGQPAQTAEVIDQVRWMHTGDVAVMVPEDILDAQVIGVPDARYGEELCAWVLLRPGALELTTRHCGTTPPASSRIARFRVTCTWWRSSR